MSETKVNNFGNNILDESPKTEGESLLRLFGGSGRRGIAVMQAFIDESGTNPETPVLAVAGCFGEEDQWREFRKLWEPHSEDFHALNSSSRFPQLTEAMKAAGIRARLVWVKKEGYQENATAQFKSAMGNAYSCCALLCASGICLAVEPKKTAFVIEAGQPNLGMVKNILEDMMEAGDWCVGSVASAKKTDFIQLHTADFVSHICSSYDRPWWDKLFELKILECMRLTPEAIAEIAPKVKLLYRVAKSMRKAAKRGITGEEFQRFDETMKVILGADPRAVKSAMHAEVLAHMAEREAKGERKRGRKPRVKKNDN